MSLRIAPDKRPVDISRPKPCIETELVQALVNLLCISTAIEQHDFTYPLRMPPKGKRKAL
jgi:hypothetical protein